MGKVSNNGAAKRKKRVYVIVTKLTLLSNNYIFIHNYNSNSFRLMKKFIKTPLVNALLEEQVKGLSIRKMERMHLGRTGQKRV